MVLYGFMSTESVDSLFFRLLWRDMDSDTWSTSVQESNG